MNRRLGTGFVLLALATVAGTGLLHAVGAVTPSQTSPLAHKAFLALTWRGVPASELAQPPAVTPIVHPSATPTVPAATPTRAPDTATPTPEPATATPTDEPPTATPTEEPPKGRIHGRYTVAGVPLTAGYGAEGLPQIELRRCAGAECVKVDNAISDEAGAFEFVGPASVAPGEWYQVWWMNIDPLVGREFVYDWRSRRITDYQAGEEVDLGAMEIASLLLKEPCNDCHQTLPITYKWEVRDNKTDVYRWSLVQQCGDPAQRPNAWQSQPLGHRGTFTLASPPPGFRHEVRYCWFIHIEDGQRGSGTSYEQYVTAFMR